MTQSSGASAGAVPLTATGRRDRAASRDQATSASRHWVPQLVNGVLSVLVGIAILVWPNASLVVLAVLIAITLMANGLVQILMAITEPNAGGGRRVLLAVLGALSLLAGALCLRAPLQTLALLAVLIGSWWLVNGVLTLVGAMSETGEHRGWAALGGIVGVAAGLIVLLQPGISLRALEITLSVGLIVIGALWAIGAVRSRARQEELS